MREEAAKRLANGLDRAKWAKGYAVAISAELHRRGLHDRSAKLDGCCSWLLFREWSDTGKVVLRAADFCNQRKLCPGCARAAARRTVGKSAEKVLGCLAAEDLVPAFVTLTQRTGPDLAERFTNLMEGLKTAGQMRRDALRGKSSSEFGRVAGAIWHAEVKRAKAGLWHAHLHGLALLRRGDQFNLRALWPEWARCVGQDRANVDVRWTTAARKMFDRRCAFADLSAPARETIAGDLVEVLKYPVKFGRSLSPADVCDAHDVTHRRHLMRTWGALRGLREEEAAGDTAPAGGAYIDRFFRWGSTGYRHVATFGGFEGDPGPAPAPPAPLYDALGRRTRDLPTERPTRYQQQAHVHAFRRATSRECVQP